MTSRVGGTGGPHVEYVVRISFRRASGIILWYSFVNSSFQVAHLDVPWDPFPITFDMFFSKSISSDFGVTFGRIWQNGWRPAEYVYMRILTCCLVTLASPALLQPIS